MWPFSKSKPKQKQSPVATSPLEADAKVAGMMSCPVCAQDFQFYSQEARIAHLSGHQSGMGLKGMSGAKRLGL